jgi:hypothetical protein
MFQFICIYKEFRYLCEANSSYEAQQIAAGYFKVTPKQRYRISVFRSDFPVYAGDL